jgi:two-component system nitrate/nitrite sensor histidine kinase NarX
MNVPPGPGWRRLLAGRATLLLVVAAFLAVTLIGVVGMTASVLISQTLQASVTAVNLAGNLRRQSLRVSNLVMAEALGGRVGRADIRGAIDEFEIALVHPQLLEVIEREQGSAPVALYRGVAATWRERIRGDLLELSARPEGVFLPTARYEAALVEVEEFIDQVNAMVHVLEMDAERHVRQLRTILGVALVLTVGVVLVAMVLVRRRVFLPLEDLREAAQRIARRDFSARSAYSGSDELGQLGEAFNSMAAELSGAYADLEKRVAEKTADLVRTNQSLDLLYRVIARLYHAPASAESYAEAMTDIERTLALKGCGVCVHSKYGGPATLLFSSLGGCPGLDRSVPDASERCPGRTVPWSYVREDGNDVLRVPLRDADNFYGVLRLVLPPGERLAGWQTTLVEALSRHMAIALGISRQTERERLIALQEERSVIARELHDSIAQALSYMKIQASLLQPVLSDPQRHEAASELLNGLREGINAAYRQLRELLTSFRLKIEGDFERLLHATAEEFSARSGIPVDVDHELAGMSLGANQEIHVLHIIREALSNATRHADARRISVVLARQADDLVSVVIADDGKGFDAGDGSGLHHYGLAIMAERAQSLGGRLEIDSAPGRGTRLTVLFDPSRPPREPLLFEDTADHNE